MTPETRIIIGTLATLYCLLISYCVKARPALWIRLPYTLRMLAIGVMGFMLWVTLMGASDCSDPNPGAAAADCVTSVHNGHVTPCQP